MSADYTRPQGMTIRSQDDYELFHHIQMSWDSIKATSRELRSRGQVVSLLDIRDLNIKQLPENYQVIMEKKNV